MFEYNVIKVNIVPLSTSYSIHRFYNYLEDDREQSSYVKKKLDDAMQRKIAEIEVRRQAEESEKMKLKNMTKHQKEKYKDKMNGKVDQK